MSTCQVGQISHWITILLCAKVNISTDIPVHVISTLLGSSRQLISCLQPMVSCVAHVVRWRLTNVRQPNWSNIAFKQSLSNRCAFLKEKQIWLCSCYSGQDSSWDHLPRRFNRKSYPCQHQPVWGCGQLGSAYCHRQRGGNSNCDSDLWPYPETWVAVSFWVLHYPVPSIWRIGQHSRVHFYHISR